MKRDFLDLRSLSRKELEDLLQLAAKLKSELKAGRQEPYLKGQSLAMIFEKPSLRTRVTFEVGISQLGGYPIYMTPTDIQLARRESVPDAARLAKRFVHRGLVEAYVAGRGRFLGGRDEE